MENETICNARIESCLLGFFTIAADMPNFIVRMELKLATGGVVVVDMNPVKIPRLLELLDVPGFNILETEYVQVKFKGNERPNFIKPIMAKPSDPWFELDNGKYFGRRINLFESEPKKEEEKGV